MYGYGERNVEEELPVVVRVRAPICDVDFLRKGIDLDKIAGVERIETREEVRLQSGVKRRVEHARQRFPIELLDQLPHERMEEVLECVRELRLLFVGPEAKSRQSLILRLGMIANDRDCLARHLFSLLPDRESLN